MSNTRGRRLAALIALPALALGATLALDVAPAAAAAQTRYVAPTGDDGNNPANACTDQSSPCKTIQHAVDEADSGDTVSVAAGTYAESVFVLDKSLTVRGPASGTAAITGAGGAPGVVAEAEGGASLTLSRLRVTNADGVYGVVGAGVRTTISHSNIAGNAVAGVLVEGADLTVTDSMISDTRGPEEEPDEATGVEVLGGKLNMARSTVSGSAEIGVALESDGPGGPASAPSLISDSTISGNAFGGVGNVDGDLTIEASTVAGNGGVGVYGAESSTIVRNSTVSGTARSTNPPPGAPTDPAGLYYETRIANATAALAPSRTARIRVPGRRDLVLRAPAASRARVAAAAQGITVSGSVLDQAGTTPDCAPEGITDAGYNLSADAGNSCGFSEGAHDVVKTDPQLGALADNGGATRTQLPPKGSAAIDAIPSGTAGCTSGAADQRGVARPQGTRCDIGAVEVTQSPLTIGPASLPHGTVGTAYREQLHASGGLGAPYAFSLATGSSLPEGLKLSGSGEISGTPTKAGTVAFTVSVDDPVTRRYTLVIDPAPSSSSAQPNGSGSRLADTGAPTSRLTATGGMAVLAGLVLLVGAGAVGRRRGRHRAG